ncbi:MAG: hypothetical protein KF745_12150 [Phycisphaeraceae bacterium]|nr:hypothetical protein [Phycisphaeraceae bacterium]
MQPRMTTSAAASILLGAACLVAGLAGGCSTYTTPGKAADFAALGITKDQQAGLTDADIAVRLSRKPAASFPASIAAVRIQDQNYSSYTYGGSRNRGTFSVVTLREVETTEQLQRLESLPMVRGVAPVNRLVINDRISSERDLRAAAADLHADIVFVYTFDTVFGSETVIPALGVFTLGLFPDKEAQVTSTASASLIDTRTGYIYGLAEATAKTTQAANAWTSREAVDQSRRRAEAEAFEKLVGEVETTWRQVAATYGPAAPPAAGSTAAEVIVETAKQ